MLRKWTSFALGSTAAMAAAEAEEKSYELVSGTLEGRLTVAFVTQAGTAVAVELDEDRPQVISGLAAGAILSDLRGGLDDETWAMASADMASTDMAGPQTRLGPGGGLRASRSEAVALIDQLPHLSATQRSELRSYLAV